MGALIQLGYWMIKCLFIIDTISSISAMNCPRYKCKSCTYLLGYLYFLEVIPGAAFNTVFIRRITHRWFSARLK